ncbi:DEAD/DEAH box helicase [Paenibacillus mucilaginosus]|uniref:DEAD/DEAH box helicase n=1 Tax=Paenibacillus mucilaginosus TaxID=61624 RepID=UPI001EEFD073|nr:DEAD/DEAH box helicase [Paenibacillus mucilaginosus]MCG7212978.1 DEAD/DEAH box helicase [Paenibacillus mucilaginosus]WDM26610.1 DEAD/DEAH box helicase [Paenibacillus mucilaginosus]
MMALTTGFASLHINPHFVQRLEELEITEPSPIQADAIPVALTGKDLVAQSQTGTGKTLAYALPVLQKLDENLREVQALVLVPTRELGMQIVQTVEELTKGTGLRVQQLIGGASIDRQIEKLRTKPQIVVGTPGRVQELVKLRKLKLHGIKTVVVDEVDQVFELGSMQDVEALFKGMLRDRQLLFFSATFPPPIQAVIDRWMNDPEYVRVKPAQRTSETLEHVYFVCEEREKIDTLRKLVRLYNPRAAIVFINETDNIGEAVAKLQYAGLSVEGLYGDSFKQERARTMQGFRAGRFQLLLATDVAARGLDLPQVTHVINLDPALDADHYVHRVGRTGRMGRKGMAVSIVTPRQQFILEKFEKALGITIERRVMSHGRLIDPEQERAIRQESKRKLVERRVPGGEDGSGASAEPGAAQRRDTAAGAARAARPAAERSDGPAGAPREGRVPERGEGTAAGRPAARTAGAPVPGARAPRSPQPAPDKRKAERERDRKNKGAPRWLKEKQDKPKG